LPLDPDEVPRIGPFEYHLKAPGDFLDNPPQHVCQTNFIRLKTREALFQELREFVAVTLQLGIA